MKEVKVVIGANWGDEGKGFCTDQFTHKARKENKYVLNILFNGGPQRGHTVDYNFFGKWSHHTYRHMGAGTLSGANTYFDEDFMVCPMEFVEEYSDLREEYPIPTVSARFYVNRDCRVITPFDMMANQVEEFTRGEKFSTCGYGIWRTRCRYAESIYKGFADRYWGDYVKMSDPELTEYLNNIKEYYILKFGNSLVESSYWTHFNNPELIAHFIRDVRRMNELTECVTQNRYEGLLDSYDTIIWEAGQGLGLDFSVDPIYATASATTSSVPMLRTVLANQTVGYFSGKKSNEPLPVEVCYVTRTYFTRHGLGPLPNEKIGVSAVDITNITNQFQGRMRIGDFDIDNMLNRIIEDKPESFITKSDNIQLTKSLLVTHENEVKPDAKLDRISIFGKVYHSDNRFTSTINIVNIV